MSAIHNNRGIGLVEVLVAIMLVSIALVAVLAMQPQALMTAGRTDHLGRAAGILLNELERNEAIIMNPTMDIPASSTRNVYTGGEGDAYAPKSGDTTYTVATTIATSGANAWRVTTRITWPGNATGISGSILATRQEAFRF